MTNITFNQFLQEQSLVEGLEASGLTEEIIQQDQSGEWSNALTADELFEALESDSTI